MIIKKEDVFQFYRQQKGNILCLQDTHFTEDMENDLINGWGYTVYSNSFSSQYFLTITFILSYIEKNLMIQVFFWLWILQLKIVA